MKAYCSSRMLALVAGLVSHTALLAQARGWTWGRRHYPFARKGCGSCNKPTTDQITIVDEASLRLGIQSAYGVTTRGTPVPCIKQGTAAGFMRTGILTSEHCLQVRLGVGYQYSAVSEQSHPSRFRPLLSPLVFGSVPSVATGRYGSTTTSWME
ncbi:uncharacterized protein B0I36DRAFT_324108 [Microdochium trichocladiopsis]|uniref:Uncharacterized protein n=1 Tax=Microdochium trichocladiopsis TaxID=1682393 RepID=A0A9P8Y7V7_9PEZI|nr:uncharacterized protein B0I36DRAFT_324108 [Microdochium trichocladiopsis]KAH7031542.1 hypothetical protein B0I36DRAFT_324108 [Microdochium trichocladiopsis]